MAGLIQRLLPARGEGSDSSGAITPLYPRVLVVSADVRFYADVLSAVNSRVWQVDWARTVEAAVAICRMGATPIAIYDQNLPRADWREAFRRLHGEPWAPRVVLATAGEVDEALWRSVLSNKGYDAVPRNAHSSELKRALRFAWLAVCEAPDND
jgi:DNA-binding response OmpR family regulator